MNSWEAHPESTLDSNVGRDSRNALTEYAHGMVSRNWVTEPVMQTPAPLTETPYSSAYCCSNEAAEARSSSCESYALDLLTVQYFQAR